MRGGWRRAIDLSCPPLLDPPWLPKLPPRGGGKADPWDLVVSCQCCHPGHLLTYTRYWICQSVSPKVFEPSTSSAAHEGSGGRGKEANECNRLGENISHFFHSCNRPRPGWYGIAPQMTDMHVCPLTFCCNQWRAARFHSPLVSKHTFHLKQRSEPHPQPYCALPTCQ